MTSPSPDRPRPARPSLVTRPSVNIRRPTSTNVLRDASQVTRSAVGPATPSTSAAAPADPPLASASTLSSTSTDSIQPSSPSGLERVPTRPAATHHNLSTVEEAETPRAANVEPESPTINNGPDAASASTTITSTAGPSHFEPISARRRLLTTSRSYLGLGRTNTNIDAPSTGRSRANSKNSQGRSRAGSDPRADYDNDLINLLDVIDPEVSTLSTLTNLQNSLFVPNLGPLLNRRATYTLTRTPTAVALSKEPVVDPNRAPAEQLQEEVDSRAEQAALKRRSHATIDSTLSETRYAVLPHGVSLEGWSDGEKDELNDYVRHLLHSRRAAFKRSMKGFGQYVRKPLGFFVTLYATLITLFGLAWVLFLIGWINVGGRQLYIIHVIDNVLVALFAIMGWGLAPFRTVDTYHMIFIAHYTRLTWRLRKEKNLPKLPNHNDLPVGVDASKLPSYKSDVDLEAADSTNNLMRSESTILAKKIVLSSEQQRKLEHHQAKFQKSHTFYKPHETETHFAFPVKLLIVIVVLLDCHSCLQIALGLCTWTIDYRIRPFALTTVILCCSLACNISGGILISVGDHRTRKKEVKERMFRQQLTEDAMSKMAKRRQRERERNDELEKHVDPAVEGNVDGSSGTSGDGPPRLTLNAIVDDHDHDHDDDFMQVGQMTDARARQSITSGDFTLRFS